MDTDDLSIQTYNGIILEAEKFNHDLALQFGVLASACKDDDDYLNQAEALMKEFKKTLNKLLSNIAEIRKRRTNLSQPTGVSSSALPV